MVDFYILDIIKRVDVIIYVIDVVFKNIERFEYLLNIKMLVVVLLKRVKEIIYEVLEVV